MILEQKMKKVEMKMVEQKMELKMRMMELLKWLTSELWCEILTAVLMKSKTVEVDFEDCASDK